MQYTKEPYYLETYNTSIKSFNSPYIAKSNSFKSTVARSKSLLDTLFDNNKPRSNSLEPYFKPTYSQLFGVCDSVVDEDVFISDDESEYLTISLKPTFHLPIQKSTCSNVRDDYDNNTTFDFYL